MINSIQALRALAALLVVLHHAGSHYAAMGGYNELILAVARWGFVGVDVFFVISGFIIAHTVLAKPRGLASATAFAWHRLARIYLGYWPFLTISAALAIWFPPNSLAGFDLVSSLLLTNPNSSGLIVPVSWSLSYELYFYGLAVAAFFLPRRWVLVVVPTLLAAMLAKSVVSPPDYAAVTGFFFSEFLIEFLLGAAVRCALPAVSRRPVRWPAAAAAAAFVALGVSLGAASLPQRAYTYGFAATALLIFSLTFQNRPRHGLSALVDGIGDASYTLYLAHLPIIILFYFSGMRDLFTSSAPGVPELGLGVLIALCIGFSLIYFRTVEFPLYRWAIQRRVSAPPRPGRPEQI